MPNLRLLYILLVCLGLISNVQADLIKSISVVGVSEIEVDPDTAEISVQIERISEASKDSRAQVLQSITALVTGLKKIGVNRSQIRQSQIHQGKKTRWDQGKQVTVGYFSTVKLYIETKDLEKLVDVYDVLAKQNELRVLNTYFRNSEEQKIADEQAKLALLNAKKRATMILSADNQKLGDLIQVSEIGATAPIPSPHLEKFRVESASLNGGGGDVSAVEFSKILIKSSLNVSYEIANE